MSHWKAYFQQAEQTGKMYPSLIVYKGSYGCLTDDCDKWDSGECRRGVPCLIGRTLKAGKP